MILQKLEVFVQIKKRKRKHITLTRLDRIFRVIDERSLVSRSEGSATFDFERASSFVRQLGLEGHVIFISAEHRDTDLPLNSELHVYEIKNIVVRNLEIDLDDKSVSAMALEESVIRYAKWHFEGCRFLSRSPNMSGYVFPWCGAFRFYKNEFCFPPDGHGSEAWIFAFESGSRVWFISNNFAGAQIQTRCTGSHDGETNVKGNSSEDALLPSGQISFVANKRIGDLWIQKGYSNVEISGMNFIGRLDIDLIVDSDVGTQTSVYFGPREKIDSSFHNCLQHRSLFLTLRRLAAINHDSRMLTALDRQLERIEYFLNRNRANPSVFDFRIWIEYWQDRFLYGWRRWSSNFYTSWLRPLTMLVTGYIVMNAIPPALVVECFDVSHWLELTFRPLTEIAAYETSLSRIVGTEYNMVASSAKTFLKLVGLVEVLWIGIWAFAFAKSVKR